MQRCSLYAHYCAIVNDHHIVPLSWWEKSGVPVDTPIAKGICPNCHNNTHTAIDALLKSKDVSKLPPRAVKLAEQGIALATAAGLQMGPTL